MRMLKPALAAIAISILASPAIAQVPKAADGKPDLTGFWTHASLTPLARAPANKTLVVNEEEAKRIAEDEKRRAFEAGGPPGAADKEIAQVRAAAAEAGEAPLLRHEATLERLRRGRETHNLPGRYAIFGLQPQAADAARAWTIPLMRPAHVLLATDGFSALVDRYGAYDAGGIVRAALDKGLAQLGVELRAIEADDPGGTAHPRWKRSDDATALLLRLV